MIIQYYTYVYVSENIHFLGEKMPHLRDLGHRLL